MVFIDLEKAIIESQRIIGVGFRKKKVCLLFILTL